MISALSGAGSRALLSLFGRPKSQGPAEEISQVAQRPAVSNSSPDTARGVPPESLFAALVDQTGAPADLSSKAIAALDRDGNGTLSAAELMEAYQSVASSGTFASVAGLVSNILASVDGNGDGALSGDELTSAVSRLATGGRSQDEGFNRLLDQIMAQLDADGNGALSRSEVAQALGVDGASLPAAALGIENRPVTAPKSMYEAIFSMRVDPSGGTASAEAREAIATRLRDQLMG